MQPFPICPTKAGFPLQRNLWKLHFHPADGSTVPVEGGDLPQKWVGTQKKSLLIEIFE